MSRSKSRRNRSTGRRSGNNSNNNSANNDSANNDSANNNSANNNSANNNSANNDDGTSRADRFTTETKEATKTTELIAFVLAVAGVAITAFAVDGSPDFGAERAWLYITILTVGYMISRGLAKAGSREPYDHYDD